MNIRTEEDVLLKFPYKALKQRSFALKYCAVSLKMLYAYGLLFGAQKGMKKSYASSLTIQSQVTLAAKISY
jgi:hypothetical protein